MIWNCEAKSRWIMIHLYFTGSAAGTDFKYFSLLTHGRPRHTFIVYGGVSNAGGSTTNIAGFP